MIGEQPGTGIERQEIGAAVGKSLGTIVWFRGIFNLFMKRSDEDLGFQSLRKNVR